MTEQQGAQRGLEFLNTESMGAESLNQGFTKGASGTQGVSQLTVAPVFYDYAP